MSARSKGSVLWPCVVSVLVGIIWASVWQVGDPLGFWFQPMLGLIVGLIFQRLTTDEGENSMEIGNGLVAALLVAGTILIPYWNQLPRTLPTQEVSIHEQLDDALVALATDVAMERENEGIKLTWPPDMNVDYAAKQGDFPPDVWREALHQWKKLSAAEQTKFLELRTELQQQLAPPALVAAGRGFGGQLAWLLVSLACTFIPASRIFVW